MYYITFLLIVSYIIIIIWNLLHIYNDPNMFGDIRWSKPTALQIKQLTVQIVT